MSSHLIRVPTSFGVFLQCICRSRLRAWRATAPLLVACVAIVSGCARTDSAWLAELDAPDPFARALAALALAEQAPAHARQALPVLLETVDRAELGLQTEATLGLVALAPSVIDELFTELARDEFMTEDRRQAIMTALLNVGAAAVRPALRAATGESRRLADVLGKLLVQIGPPAVTPLAELIASGSAEEQAYAAWILGRMGKRARAALPALQAARADAGVELSAALTDALKRIQGGAAGGGR